MRFNLNPSRESALKCKQLLGLMFLGFIVIHSCSVFLESSPLERERQKVNRPETCSYEVSNDSCDGKIDNRMDDSTKDRKFGGLIGLSGIYDECNLTYYYLSLAFVLGAAWNFKKILKVGIL